MNALLVALGITCILGLAAMGVFLVVTEHYGWAWIPYLMACAINVRSPAKPKPDEPGKSIIEV